MDQQDGRPAGLGWAAPVEEVDPLAWPDLDEEALRLDGRVGGGRERGKAVGREVHRA